MQDFVGEELSAVTFVRDYVQLDFGGPGMNVLTPITVRAGGVVARSGDDNFRNVLCDQISKQVVGARAEEGDALTISFSDDSSVSVSLKSAAYTGPEAVMIRGRRPRWNVL